MKNKDKCVFCNSEVQKKEIIRNKYACAFLTNIPVVPGHLLICPIRCVDNFNDLTKEEISSIF